MTIIGYAYDAGLHFVTCNERKMKRIIFIIMMGSVLKFFGCTSNKSKENSQKNKEQTEFEEKIAKSLDEFQNRAIHKNLSVDITI